MSWKSNVLVATSVAVLGVGTLGYTDPLKDVAPPKDQQIQQQVGDRADNQENVDDQLRRDGNHLGDNVYRDKIGYSDVRPPEKLPHLRLRILP